MEINFSICSGIMKKFLSIKWELIIVILLGIVTIIAWSVWETDHQDWRILVLTIIPTLALVVWIISYSKVKEFRLEVKDLW